MKIHLLLMLALQASSLDAATRFISVPTSPQTFVPVTNTPRFSPLQINNPDLNNILQLSSRNSAPTFFFQNQPANIRPKTIQIFGDSPSVIQQHQNFPQTFDQHNFITTRLQQTRSGPIDAIATSATSVTQPSTFDKPQQNLNQFVGSSSMQVIAEADSPFVIRVIDNTASRIDEAQTPNRIHSQDPTAPVRSTVAPTAFRTHSQVPSVPVRVTEAPSQVANVHSQPQNIPSRVEESTVFRPSSQIQNVPVKVAVLPTPVRANSQVGQKAATVAGVPEQKPLRGRRPAKVRVRVSTKPGSGEERKAVVTLPLQDIPQLRPVEVHDSQVPTNVRRDPTKIVDQDSGDEAEEEEVEKAEKDAALNAKYSFRSEVNDSLSDSVIMREEKRENGAVEGSYSYSDGFYRRTVRYRADESGYRVLSQTVEPLGNGPKPNPEGFAKVEVQNSSGTINRYTVSADDIKPSKSLDKSEE